MLVDPVDLSDEVLGIVNPLEVRRRVEVEHLFDLVAGDVQSDEVLEATEVFKMDEVVAREI